MADGPLPSLLPLRLSFSRGCAGKAIRRRNFLSVENREKEKKKTQMRKRKWGGKRNGSQGAFRFLGLSHVEKFCGSSSLSLPELCLSTHVLCEDENKISFSLSSFFSLDCPGLGKKKNYSLRLSLSSLSWKSLFMTRNLSF